MSTDRARQTTGSPRGGRLLRVAIAGALLSVTLACTPLVTNHGYTPNEDDLTGILVGVDTRETVADVIGTPSAGGVLNDGGFYYISHTRETRGARAPQITSREVVAISFDSAGVVSNIERYGLEDGNVVALSRRVTDDNIAGVGFIRQLLGNIGNINPSTFN